MTFDQLFIPTEADEAALWAAQREFELRQRRLRRSREGVSEIVRNTTAALERFRLALAGDPALPREHEAFQR